MKTTNEEEISLSKIQITSICNKLAEHSSTVNTLLSESGPIDNPYIQGHIEAHLEKIEESIMEISCKYNIPEDAFSTDEIKEEIQLKNQKQGLKFLLNNLENLQFKVKQYLYKNSQKLKRPAASPLRDLYRKVNNDLCRTIYLLQ